MTLPFLLSSHSQSILLRWGREEMRDEAGAGAGFGLVFNLWRTWSIFFTFVLFYLDEFLSDHIH